MLAHEGERKRPLGTSSRKRWSRSNIVWRNNVRYCIVTANVEFHAVLSACAPDNIDRCAMAKLSVPRRDQPFAGL
jgi:hypothetical protein